MASIGVRDRLDLLRGRNCGSSGMNREIQNEKPAFIAKKEKVGEELERV
jgi:hypothetical protein